MWVRAKYISRLVGEASFVVSSAGKMALQATKRGTKRGAYELTLSNLEAFVAAAQSGSMAEGARKLAVSRAAISVMIKEVERKLGVKLFAGGRPKRLTPEGEVLLARVGPAVAELHEAVRLVRGEVPDEP